MSIDSLPEITAGPGEVNDAEAVVSDDVLVKVFALGPGGELTPHDHPGVTNVFHVLRGSVTVIQDGVEERINAPGIVKNSPGVVHGARNETDELVLLSASLCPMPS